MPIHAINRLLLRHSLTRACLTRREVLSREVKVLVRKMVMAGVYLTKPQMNNKMKQNDKQFVEWYRNFTVTFTCFKARCDSASE